MTVYEGAQAYSATNLLRKVCSPTKLFGHLHDKILCLANDEDNSCYTQAIGILHEPFVATIIGHFGR